MNCSFYFEALQIDQKEIADYTRIYNVTILLMK
jgi:hypothetical protein